MQSGNRQIFIAIFLVFIVLAGLIFYLESQRINSDDMESTIDARVAAVLTVEDFDSTNEARITQVADSARITSEAQRPIVLTDVALAYPSETATPTNTPTFTVTPSVTPTFTATPTATHTPFAILEIGLQEGVTEIDEFGTVQLFAWSKDGTQFALVYDDKYAVVMNISDSSLVTQARITSENDIVFIDWADTQDFIATGDTRGHISIWRGPNYTLFNTTEIFAELTDMAWLPDELRIVIAYDKNVKLLDLNGNTSSRYAYTVGNRPQVDSTTLNKPFVILDDRGMFWGNRTSRTIHPIEIAPEMATIFAQSKDGTSIAVVHNDNQVSVMKIFGSSIHTSFGLGSGTIQTIDWSGDDRMIATTDSQGFVRIWNPETGDMIYEINSNQNISNALWSPQGQTLALVGDTLQLWEIEIQE